MYVFKDYYKYVFSFENENDAEDVLYIGGDSDDIYRLSVSSGVKYTMDQLIDMGYEPD